jgi:hypothetical protein
MRVASLIPAAANSHETGQLLINVRTYGQPKMQATERLRNIAPD